MARPALELPPLVGTGRLSYGLYLYHMPVLHWLAPMEQVERNPLSVRWPWE